MKATTTEDAKMVESIGALASMKRITEMAQLLRRQNDDVARLTAELEAAKKSYTRTEQEDMPQLMIEMGLTIVGLDDGSIIELKEEVSCGISAARKPAAFAWLDTRGFGGLIKTDVTVGFNRDQREAALDLATKMREDYEAVELAESVHAGTLKKFVKEQMAAGTDIPMDLFGIHPYTIATLRTKR